MSAPRIRSVDTNPICWPSRLWERWVPPSWWPDGVPIDTPAARFAKAATVVTELYTEQLRSGDPIPAKAWWVRLVPTDGIDQARFDGVPFGDGLGEVHEVPYDPAVLALPDELRRRAILDWVQEHLRALAVSLRWPTDPLDHAYQACLAQDLRLIRASRPTSSPGRRHRAWATFEIDGDGDGWARLHLEGNGMALTSDPADALPSLTAAARTWRTLRWDAPDMVGIQPWPSDVPPPDGVSHGTGARLTLTAPAPS